MGIMLITTGAAIFLSGYVWIGLVAMKTDPDYGKWAFFSGMYRINYCRAHWDRMKIPCIATVLGMLLIFFGILF